MQNYPHFNTQITFARQGDHQHCNLFSESFDEVIFTRGASIYNVVYSVF